MLENIFFMILRRMRAPLLSLILTYAVSVLGLVLIPGQDAAGNPHHLDFFHALYFVSYMATTIGFGEIPYEFTDAQRMWVMFTIYLTVVVWIYSIGTLISLLQDPTFKQALTERSFARHIRRIRNPFYLICGYGETGEALVAALLERGQHAVVVDLEDERINALLLQNLPEYVPALLGDARRPDNLLKAGLKHPLCEGVAALTNNNQVNLKIAITSKLLHPNITVICRADSQEVETNMASFGTDHIIDPFDTFSLHLATAMHTPCLHLLYEWLTGPRSKRLSDPVYPPKEGVWVICGYGRFGKKIHQRLRDEGYEAIVIEATPDITGKPDSETKLIKGWGTEADTLVQADIKNAVGLVAGTNNDVNNLSIIMTAMELNSELFVIARQNNQDNQPLFEAVNADIVMHPSRIIANRIRVLLATPLLYQFEELALEQTDDWGCELISRILDFVINRVPDVWEVEINEDQAYAVNLAIESGRSVTLGTLLTNPGNQGTPLKCLALMLVKQDQSILLPNSNVLLDHGDKLLLCGADDVHDRMTWTLLNENALNHALTGEAVSQSYVWRMLFANKAGRKRAD